MCTEEKEKTEGAGTRFTEENRRKGSLGKKFTAKRLAVMAVFVALAYAISFLEIPLFPAAPFLKLDFGNVFILLVAFLLGPIEGVAVCLLKEGLRMLSPGATVVGELANALITSAYLVLPAVLYRFHKGLKGVIFSLGGGCLLGTGAALLANRFINFPLYMGAGAAEAFAQLFWWIVAFNLIKTAAISVLTVLLYKRLSNFFKKWKI